MKQLAHRLSLVLSVACLGSVAIATGCSSSPAAPSDGGTVTETGTALTPDPTGWIDRTTTGTTGIQGAWYGYGDLTDCTTAGHAASACSMITQPPLMGFPQTVPGSMCTSGIAAMVPTATQADYSAVWGAGIALDLNAEGGDAAVTTVKIPYNATANNVLGFSFDIDVAPPLTGMRVEFPTPATGNSAAYWNGGDGGAANSPVKKGHNVILWAKVGGPSYLTNPPLFTPSMINSIQFHIPTNTAGPVPYAFCISGLTALTN
jgi:hypothetical protein